MDLGDKFGTNIPCCSETSDDDDVRELTSLLNSLTSFLPFSTQEDRKKRIDLSKYERKKVIDLVSSDDNDDPCLTVSQENQQPDDDVNQYPARNYTLKYPLAPLETDIPVNRTARIPMTLVYDLVSDGGDDSVHSSHDTLDEMANRYSSDDVDGKEDDIKLREMMSKLSLSTLSPHRLIKTVSKRKNKREKLNQVAINKPKLVIDRLRLNPSLFITMVTFRPVSMESVVSYLKEFDIKISRSWLESFFDEQGVVWYTEKDRHKRREYNRERQEKKSAKLRQRKRRESALESLKRPL